MPRRVEGSSKREFIKKGKNSSSTKRCKCIEAMKKFREQTKMGGLGKIQGKKKKKKKKKEKKRKPARLKTQKGSLGKSQGQRKEEEEEEEEEKKNWKILPSWEFEHAT